jgi:hypothetical protein
MIQTAELTTFRLKKHSKQRWISQPGDASPIRNQMP